MMLTTASKSKQPGYTLIELLISVLIFSGVIILAIAAFARSINSGTQSNIVRAQVQAARSVTDQLSNDFHYVDATDQVTSLKTSCGGALTAFIGVRLGNSLGCDEAEVLLKYPGATGSNDLVWRLYAAQTIGSRPSIYVYELRNLSICSGALMTGACPGTVPQPPASPADLLSTNYVADGLGGLTPVFSGLDLLNAKTSFVSPYIKLHFVMKPATNTAQTCSTLGAGTCYTLDTTIIPGSI